MTTKTICPHCKQLTDVVEMIYHATLHWICLRCVEDHRVQTGG